MQTPEDPLEKPSYPPTEPVSHQYSSIPISGYGTTEPNPYVHNPYMDIPVLPPPPPQAKRKINGWMALSAILTVIILVGGTIVVMRAIQPGNSPQQAQTGQKTIVSPTAFPTKTMLPTPTTIPTIQPSQLTAQTLYEDFIQAGMPVTSPVTISNSWWLSMGENYYPTYGSIQFTDTRNGEAIELAVFAGAAAATEDAQQATSYPTGWAAQYLQVNTCLILTDEGPVNIQYYKPAMQQFCI